MNAKEANENTTIAIKNSTEYKKILDEIANAVKSGMYSIHVQTESLTDPIRIVLQKEGYRLLKSSPSWDEKKGIHLVTVIEWDSIYNYKYL